MVPAGNTSPHPDTGQLAEDLLERIRAFSGQRGGRPFLAMALHLAVNAPTGAEGFLELTLHPAPDGGRKPALHLVTKTVDLSAQ